MEKDESTQRISTTGPTKPKHSELSKKTKTLKRAGSPTLSESSGNESSRKKAKSGSVSHSRSVTPMSSGARAHGVGSFGIDTEGVPNDTVDAPPAKRMRLGADGGDMISPSRVGSPMPAIHHGQVTIGTGPIEAQEIMAQLPPLPGGTSIATLMKSFQSRVGEKPGQTSRKDWIKLVKANTVYGPDKLLRRKHGA
jgi:transcription initiation factor TFIIF subunit alpha